MILDTLALWGPEPAEAASYSSASARAEGCWWADDGCSVSQDRASPLTAPSASPDRVRIARARACVCDRLKATVLREYMRSMFGRRWRARRALLVVSMWCGASQRRRREVQAAKAQLPSVRFVPANSKRCKRILRPKRAGGDVWQMKTAYFGDSITRSASIPGIVRKAV